MADHSANEKAVQVWGFSSLIEEARSLLGLDVRSFEATASDGGWRSRFFEAGWEISRICELDTSYEAFVMNAVAFGVPTAMATADGSRVRVLVPEIPLELGFDVAVELAERMWPGDGDGRWLEATQDGRPAGVTRLFQTEPEEAPRSGVTVIKGRGIPALIARGQDRIYLDVTHATAKDVREAMKQVRKLREGMGTKSRASAPGTSVRKDEAVAIETARRHQDGESLVFIGRANGWPLYKNELKMETCPMALRYVKAGEEILQMHDALAKRLAEPPAIASTS